MRIDKTQSPILMESRYRRLLDIAKSDAIMLNSIEFRWSGPEWGWLDLEVLRDGEIVLEASSSSVYKPFCKLIPWLQNLAGSFRPCSVLDFDIERFYMQICCDYIGHIKIGEKYQQIALFTLALDWDEDLKHAYFILPVHDFVGRLYYSLHDHFMTHKAAFMQEWQDHEFDDDCLNLIEAELTSKDLEKLIPRIGKAPEIQPPTIEIPVTEEAAFAILDAKCTNGQLVSNSEVYRWICDNWVFSHYDEDKAIKDKRAECFLMMSQGEIDYDFEWCFSNADSVVHTFLERYRSYKNTRISENK